MSTVWLILQHHSLSNVLKLLASTRCDSDIDFLRTRLRYSAICSLQCVDVPIVIKLIFKGRQHRNIKEGKIGRLLPLALLTLTHCHKAIEVFQVKRFVAFCPNLNLAFLFLAGLQTSG